MKDIELTLKAIGIVQCETIPEAQLRFGQQACIEVFPEYLPALKRFEEHDYFWILCWLHKADRSLLETCSWHLKKNTEETYGVFSLRSPCRPNPISLTLVKLIRKEDSKLYVDGLDVFDQTIVLDIKPYKKNEAIVSPKAPYIRPQSDETVRRCMHLKALSHHKEECSALKAGINMAMQAEKILGDITDEDVSVHVSGSACLADVIQGITGARIANPRRFFFSENDAASECIWIRHDKRIITRQDPKGQSKVMKPEPGGSDADPILTLYTE